MELSYRLEVADYIEYVSHCRAIAKRPQAPYYWWLIVPGLVVAITVVTGCNLMVSFGIVTVFVLATAIHSVSYTKNYYTQYYTAEKLDGLVGPRTIKLTAEAFMETSKRCDLVYRWMPHYRVASTNNLILLHVGALQAFIIPKRIFASEQDATALMNQAKEFIALVQSK